MTIEDHWTDMPVPELIKEILEMLDEMGRSDLIELARMLELAGWNATE